jgi:ribosomal protein S18 acetylase RimI-like enzyme
VEKTQAGYVMLPMPHELSFITVTPASRDEALAVMLEAARRQAELGARAWTADDLEQTVDGALARDELHLVRREGGAVAAFVLQWQDELFWGVRPDDAGYVHALAVARDAAGMGIGRAVLAWCEARVRMAGRRYLRLDTDADNPRLNAYYLDAGFVLRGVLPSVRGMRASLFEKPVGTQAPTDPLAGS